MSTETSTNYNIRIDTDLRDRAFAVFDSYGLAPAQAIKLFLNQVADTQVIPLSFDYNVHKSKATAPRKRRKKGSSEDSQN